MDLNEIKKIIQEEKTKIIIATEDGPAMVIMSYDDYKKTKGRKEEVVPSVPKAPKELEAESLKIDDLPF
jgi:PHD/YefM family antitoxin component YafN of YafNO toxin-antitoxin module